MAAIDKDLKTRFGISQNFNAEVYDVILEFAFVTGEFVKAHLWHHSQTFETMPNGNVRMYLKCGINRELIGWIYMWMGHVKIVQPEQLKQYHKEQLNSILTVSQSDGLVYNDLSKPD